MKKRALSLLMSLVMLVSMLPTTAWAADETETTTPPTVNVDFTAQAKGAFLIAPQFNVAVSSDEAENFGYTDSVEGVSALDVLVKAHEIKFGEDFTKTSSADYLEVSSSGFVTKLFATTTTAIGFTLNGAYPHDGTAASSGGYKGTTVTTQAVVDNDSLEFFIDQDVTSCSDNLAWFCQNGVFTDTVTAKPSAAVDVVLKSTSYKGGYMFRDAEAMHAAGSIVKGAQLAWVNITTGEVTAIKNAVTNEETGKVTLTMPADEGTSYLTAYMPASGIKDGKSPLIMSLTKVVADNNAVEADPCALSSLVIKGYPEIGFDQEVLALTPEFSPEIAAYSTTKRPFGASTLAKTLIVSPTAANSDATIKATLNGENEKDFSTQPVQNFNTMLPGQDNRLTITVTNGEQSKTYTVTIPMAADPSAPVVPDVDASITVPSDATVFVGSKSKHYVPFTGIQSAGTKDNQDGTCTYYFDLTDNKTYNYRISGENYITYAGTFKKTAGWSLTVSKEDLQPQGKDKTTIDRDVKNNNGYNVGDVYLNINPQSYLKLGHAGDTYQLVNLRNWEAVDSVMNNYFIEPDYHYAVLDMNGQVDTSVVEVSDSGLLTAKSQGTAIVLVTYDAININAAVGGPFFGAIWPENTGVFVVSVGAGDSGISTDITLNTDKGNTTDSKLAGDALDAEHDVIYFVGESGSYTFTPGIGGVRVSVANPTVSDKMSFNGFKDVAANDDNSVTVPLVQGRNIVKLEKDGKAEYQIITAKQLSVTVNSGDPVHPGDELTVSLNGLYHPANKLAGVYNMDAVVLYDKVDGYDQSTSIGTPSRQYNFASAQNDLAVLKKTELWGKPSYSKDTSTTFKVPDDYDKDVLTLSGGSILVCGWGDPFGNHRGITLTSGKAPNLNANTRVAYLGQLPDIQIPITVTDAALDHITLTTDEVKTSYDEGDGFDPANLIVTAVYADGKTQQVSGYTVSPEKLTADTKEVTVSYQGKTATIPVTVAPAVLTEITVTKQPAKTAYKAGDFFDPTGMEITAVYSSGRTEVVTDYTYAPNRELTTTDSAMTITYGGKTVALPITVSSGSQGGGSQKQTITVTFTLMGDSKHGDNGEVHTLKNRTLETWIARTSVTVDKDAYVIDVIAKALSMAGIPYENGGNYISSVRGLEEFDNGGNSGWMYTLNGNHSDLGVEEQRIKQGDSIVFHYTDDYTKEQGSEKWNSGSSSGTTTTPTTPTTPANPVPDKAMSFTDVKSNDWYYSSVRYAYDNGLFSGVSHDSFGPGDSMDRSMLATVLYSLDGKPAAGKSGFADVADGAWYADAVAWAAEHGIVSGVGGGAFTPGGTITREQLAVMLYRYAQYKGYDVSKTADLSGYADQDKLSDWAAQAVQWACGSGLMNGRSAAQLAPEGTLTRAEAATMLKAFCENVKK